MPRKNPGAPYFLIHVYPSLERVKARLGNDLLDELQLLQQMRFLVHSVLFANRACLCRIRQLVKCVIKMG